MTVASRPLIYFSCHEQTDWNQARRIQGQLECDITGQGRMEADRNGRKLKELIGAGNGFDFVASPLRRTWETMERIRIAMGLGPQGYQTAPRLMELNFGDWQGFTEAEVVMKAPDQVAARQADKWNFLPSGRAAESYVMLGRRISRWMETVTRETVLLPMAGACAVFFTLMEG